MPSLRNAALLLLAAMSCAGRVRQVAGGRGPQLLRTAAATASAGIQPSPPTPLSICDCCAATRSAGAYLGDGQLARLLRTSC
jgi:hypothetical protein